ncbi:MAG: methionine--tRNA ligase [Deltaproteobacteria bacterium]|nr:methionine--tRNA ligase [Deltaproteobacteria bacterium]
MARYQRLRGREVFFLTGTDEHGVKIEKTAIQKGMTPRELVDEVVERFKHLWRVLNISNDDFIRTTEERHARAVVAFFRQVQEKGDIYLGTYEDWYCVPCETFWTAKQLADGNCPECGRPAERVSEESYFFRMSRYRERLLAYIEEHPDFIQPESKRNEILSFVREELRDLSISRTSFTWGIPVPGDEKHVIYVWFDALVNYLTAAGYPDDPERFARLWPADIHLIGKDILRFHAVYWPTFLFAAGLPLPGKVFAHGWWTVEGEKMSKSLGNVVDPVAMADEYGVDPFRYFLLREVPFGLDGDFSRQAMKNRLNSELANDLGNLFSRSLAMIRKYRGGRVPAPNPGDPRYGEFAELAAAVAAEVEAGFGQLAFSRVLQAIWQLVTRANKFVDEQAPWQLAKDESAAADLDQVLYCLAEVMRLLTVYLLPFMPDKGREMARQLGLPGLVEQRGVELFTWGQLPAATEVVKGKPIFPRLD